MVLNLYGYPSIHSKLQNKHLVTKYYKFLKEEEEEEKEKHAEGN